MRNSDKPAFPSDYNYGEKGEFGEPIIVHKVSFGLTKREYFAAKAMQGLLAKEAWLERNEHDIKFNTIIAKAAVSIADQLLNQLEN